MAIQPLVADETPEHGLAPGHVVVREHPVELMVAGLEASLGSAPVQAWAGLEPAVVRSLYGRVARVVERLSAHKMAAARVLETAGTAKAAGAASTGSLLGGDFGGDRREGDGLVRLGQTLARAKASGTEGAFAAGEITRAQAQVIGSILGSLDADVTQSEREAAEATLLGEAQGLSLRDLRARGDRITEAFRPLDQVDRDEEQAVRARERAAWAATEFWMRDTGAGTYQGGFTIPTVAGELLKTMLDAVASPRRNHLRRTDNPTNSNGAGNGSGNATGAFGPAVGNAGSTGGVGGAGAGGGGGPVGVVDEGSYQQRLGQAFCALIEHAPTDGYAPAGGSAAVVAVSLSQEKLVSGIGCGTTSTGVRLTAGEIRRLACNQRVLPQVFDGSSLPLDHGVARRLFTRHQRIAIGQRDMGCVMPGCDRPPGWCELHHAGQPWAAGGRTDLDQGVMLCAFHHHLVHEQGWVIRFHPDDGIPEFRAPGTPKDAWTRNARYRPPRDLGVAPTTA
ncbi:HNH endonuclease signature motif containing protein [Ornithinicoccus hortensis]|uniref:Uncharacterized protein DUF222 n=1 Tax=Ornithinicoccus hortensis TaxID=82346 RepID=A0A542YUH4_9MICO|nr:HNH endonuclease signature motif containing protein [Ornithinicoccus hortensis]TQL51733.1 uncharacterized protein DUF222 [Ornithinicoccus hortensis]